MKEFLVTMLVKAENEAEATNVACELLNSGTDPDSVTENVCATCNETREHYLHLPAKDCKDCKAPQDHHTFTYKTFGL